MFDSQLPRTNQFIAFPTMIPNLDEDEVEKISTLLPSEIEQESDDPFDDSITLSQLDALSQEYKTQKSNTVNDYEIPLFDSCDSMGFTSEDYRDMAIGLENKKKLTMENKTSNGDIQQYKGDDVLSIAMTITDYWMKKDEKELEEKTMKTLQRMRKGVTSPTFDLGLSSQEEPQQEQIKDKQVKQPSFLLESPFKQRVVDISSITTPDEDNYYKWIQECRPDKDM